MNKILAVIYVIYMFRKLLNCSLMFSKVCIHLHHHFVPDIVNEIICDFPSSGVLFFLQIISFFWFSKQWFNFFVVDLVLTREVLKRVSFVKWDGEERLDTMSQWCASVLLLSGKQGIILDADLTLFEWALSVRFTWDVNK